MIGLEDNELLLRCSCGSKDHIAFLIHEPDDSRGNKLKEEDDDWYLSVLLDEFPFLRRLRRGLVYIFAPHRLRLGMYMELVLKNQDMDAIVAFISRRKIAIVAQRASKPKE